MNDIKVNNSPSNISSTKRKCGHNVKRKRTKNKRSSKRKHSFCIIV